MRRRPVANVLRLGVKELRSLTRDPIMLLLIVYAFTAAIYIAGAAAPEGLRRAAIAIVDEDHSTLSARIASAFQPPYFAPPVHVLIDEADAGLDAGRFTFVLDIPPNFQEDVLAGDSPDLQLSVDATRMSQAFTGSGYIQEIVLSEVDEFVSGVRGGQAMPVELALRARFNPNLDTYWFTSMNEVISMVTMLSVVLAGAALIREREHGAIEHLLSLPLAPVEIMAAKVWSVGLVVLLGAAFALVVMVQWVLGVAVHGSVGLWLVGAALHLCATTSMGILMATMAPTMPQFGQLSVITLIPLELLSGGATPRESMPEIVQTVMLAAPTTHFISASQAILFRGAGLEDVWPQFVAIAGLGAVFFAMALARFRRTLALAG